jgi:hypothetical protein
MEMREDKGEGREGESVGRGVLLSLNHSSFTDSLMGEEEGGERERERQLLSGPYLSRAPSLRGLVIEDPSFPPLRTSSHTRGESPSVVSVFT